MLGVSVPLSQELRLNIHSRVKNSLLGKLRTDMTLKFEEVEEGVISLEK